MSAITAIGPQAQATNLAATMIQAKQQQAGQNQGPLKCQIEVTNMPPKGGAGKAWTSAIIPGMGQFLDGRNKAGAAFLSSELLTLVGAIGLGALASAGRSVAAGLGAVVSGVAFLTLKFMDVVNAYKGPKS